jgi:hypothetical protein
MRCGEFGLGAFGDGTGLMVCGERRNGLAASTPAALTR